MTMYDAPSDRDYAGFLNPSDPEGEDPDNELPDSKLWVMPIMRTTEDDTDECPF